jgi:hypothetical protein
MRRHRGGEPVERTDNLDRVLESQLRNTGTAGYDAVHQVLTLDFDLGAEDLSPGSLVTTAIATATDRDLQVRNNAADRHTRFGERLSAEDRALLQELERQRLAHVEGVDVTEIEPAPEGWSREPARRRDIREGPHERGRRRRRGAAAEMAQERTGRMCGPGGGQRASSTATV